MSSKKEPVNNEVYQSQTQRFEANNGRVIFQNVHAESLLDNIPVDTQTPMKTLTPMTLVETLTPVETRIPPHSTYIIQKRKQQGLKRKGRAVWLVCLPILVCWLIDDCVDNVDNVNGDISGIQRYFWT